MQIGLASSNLTSQSSHSTIVIILVRGTSMTRSAHVVSVAARSALAVIGFDAVPRMLRGHMIRVPIAGHPLRRLLFDKNYLENHPEKEYFDEVMSRVQAGDSVVEVGAFHAFFTIPFSQEVGQEGTVLAFEPNPKSAAIVRKSLQQNGCSNATLLQLAVGATDGDALLTLSEGGSSLLERAGVDHVHVKVVTLDGSLAEAAVEPRLIKVDVEGFEAAVLAGAPQTMEKCEVLCLEIHPAKMKAATDTPVKELYASILRRGLRPVYEYRRVASRQESGRPYNVIFERRP